MDAQDEAFRDVAQFADIARPVVGHELAALGFRQDRRIAAVARRGLENEVFEQQRDVLPPVAERREFN